MKTFRGNPVAVVSLFLAIRRCINSVLQPASEEIAGVWLSCGISVCSVSLPLLYLISAVTVSSVSMFGVVGISSALEDWLSDIIVLSWAWCLSYFLLQLFKIIIYFCRPFPFYIFLQQFSVVFLDKFFRKFEKCCIDPKNDFSSLVFVGAFSFVIASVSS